MNTPVEPIPEAPVGVNSLELVSNAIRSKPFLEPDKGVRGQQIEGLVQQLFLQREPRAHHVAFSAVEIDTDTARLCLDVATTLSEVCAHDVGLVDARLQSIPLHTQLEIELDGGEPEARELRSHLWFVPRWTWLDEGLSAQIWNSSLSRLRTAAVEFDYSIVSLDPLSWVTARISQVCDGLVLVVTANRTRRLVAAQIREQLKRARVPLLGTILAERRFPVPEGLYSSL